MARNFSIEFTNGVASDQVIEYGSYNLSIDNVSGYANASITPSSIDIDSATAALDISLTADGSATLTVKGNSGDPVTSLTADNFKRYVNLSDETGYAPASDAIDLTDAATGVYIVKFLPYIDTTGIDVFFKISGADFETQDVTISMVSQDVSLDVTIQNDVTVNASLVDDKYSRFPLDGTIEGTTV